MTLPAELAFMLKSMWESVVMTRGPECLVCRMFLLHNFPPLSGYMQLQRGLTCCCIQLARALESGVTVSDKTLYLKRRVAGIRGSKVCLRAAGFSHEAHKCMLNHCRQRKNPGGQKRNP